MWLLKVPMSTPFYLESQPRLVETTLSFLQWGLHPHSLPLADNSFTPTCSNLCTWLWYSPTAVTIFLWINALTTSVYRDKEIREFSVPWCMCMHVTKALIQVGKRNCWAYFPISDKNLSLLYQNWKFFQLCGRNQSFLFQNPVATLQNGSYLDRVISLAALLPKQANQLHCWSTIGLLCNLICRQVNN